MSSKKASSEDRDDTIALLALLLLGALGLSRSRSGESEERWYEFGEVVDVADYELTDDTTPPPPAPTGEDDIPFVDTVRTEPPDFLPPTPNPIVDDTPWTAPLIYATTEPLEAPPVPGTPGGVPTGPGVPGLPDVPIIPPVGPVRDPAREPTPTRAPPSPVRGPVPVSARADARSERAWGPAATIARGELYAAPASSQSGPGLSIQQAGTVVVGTAGAAGIGGGLIRTPAVSSRPTAVPAIGAGPTFTPTNLATGAALYAYPRALVGAVERTFNTPAPTARSFGAFNDADPRNYTNSAPAPRTSAPPPPASSPSPNPNVVLLPPPPPPDANVAFTNQALARAASGNYRGGF